jgi:ribonuclease P protein component
MQPVNNRYGKAMRLTANKDITALFLTGKAFFVFPYRVVYQMQPPAAEANSILKMAPSVSKKKFKRAVKRNYVKRITREAYRTQCQVLQQLCMDNKTQLHIVLQYTHPEILSFAEIQKAMVNIIEQLFLQVENRKNLL